MFIGRGLKQNKKVQTSSLIFIANNNMPSKNHYIEIIKYINRDDDIDICLKNISVGKRIKKKRLLQSDLLDNFLNWNYIKHEDDFLNLYNEYLNNKNLSEYYMHDKAIIKYGNKFYFDRGLKYPKDKINKGKSLKDCYYIAKYNKYAYRAFSSEEFIDKKLLVFPHGSQGEEVYKRKYKVIWRYINYDRFRFSEDNIMIDYNNVIITSDNKNELLYLLAIFNSSVITKILKSLLWNEDEKDILIGIKTIKEFVKIPIINDNNIDLKKEIISKTNELLKLEQVRLLNLVDFSDLLIQKVDSISIHENNLVLLKDNKEIKCKILENKELIIKNLESIYKGDLLKKDINLSDLKYLEILDLETQTRLKNHIDNLIFLLYFFNKKKKINYKNESILKTECKKHAYYSIINTY